MTDTNRGAERPTCWPPKQDVMFPHVKPGKSSLTVFGKKSSIHELCIEEPFSAVPWKIQMSIKTHSGLSLIELLFTPFKRNRQYRKTGANGKGEALTGVTVGI